MSGDGVLSLVNGERRYQAADGGFRLFVPQLSIARGERLCVLGSSGSGKSTLLDLLALISPPDRGDGFTLSADGRNYDLLRAWKGGYRHIIAKLRARYIGYVLQTGGLLPYLSVEDNLALSLRLLGLPVPGPLPALAKAVGIETLLSRMPAQLSIGQRQRVVLVRAIAHQPRLVLADEPTSAVSADQAGELVDLLVEMTARVGAALVLVTHDPDIVKRAQGRVLYCRQAPSRGIPTSVLVEG